MGPLDQGLYKHPWIPEAYHEWRNDDGHISCFSFYRYPESPEFGFYVQTCETALYYVGPVKFEGAVAERSGTAYACYFHDSIDDMVDSLYLKNEAMEKVHNLNFFEVDLAPF